MNPGTRAWPLALAAVTLAVVAAMLRVGMGQHGSFKAFYCGAQAVRMQANPYIVEPLRTCEHDVAPNALPAQAVEPAPLPGYALAFFVPFTLLPFGVAFGAFAFLSLAAAIAAAAALARLTLFPAAVILVILAPLLLLNIAYGELPILAMAALSISGYALRRERYIAAAAAVGAVMLQPQIGIAAAAGLFVLAPRCRVALLVMFAVLAIVSVAALGPAENLAYFQAYLPAQARAEVAAADQYGLAHQLYVLGIDGGLALRIASVVSSVALVAGICAGGLASKRLHAPEFIVFLPAAAVLLGAVYAHDIQVIVALPAAIAAAAIIRLRERLSALLVLLALSLVWTERPGRALLAIDCAAIAAVCAACLSGRFLAKASAAALCVITFVAAISVLQVPRKPYYTRVMTSIPGSELAADAWRAYLNATPSRTSDEVRLTGQKVPAWLGVALLIAVCVRRR